MIVIISFKSDVCKNVTFTHLKKSNWGVEPVELPFKLYMWYEKNRITSTI